MVCSYKTFLIQLDLVFTRYKFKMTLHLSLLQEIQLFSSLPFVSLISFGSPFQFEFNVPMQVIFSRIAFQPEEWMYGSDPWKCLYVSVNSHVAHSLQQFVLLRLMCPLYGFQLLLLAFRYVTHYNTIKNVRRPRADQTAQIKVRLYLADLSLLYVFNDIPPLVLYNVSSMAI